MTKHGRNRRRIPFLFATGLLALALIGAACGGKEEEPRVPAEEETAAQTEKTPPASRIVNDLIADGETTLSNLRQLTFEGDNGEAYFNEDATEIVWQSTRGGHEYDQIYHMKKNGAEKRMLSKGVGRTTCAYFMPDRTGIIYASTHLRPQTPPKPEGHGSYEWSFDPAFDIFHADYEGRILRRLTESPGYDAEGTISPDGSKMVWTSERDGDLDIYVLDFESDSVTRITNEPGYDGGAFFSPDGERIVYRASRTESYKDLQIHICDADGTIHRRLTDNDAVNFAPYFHPDGEHIVFSSNMDEPRNFELYMIRTDGSQLTRITTAPGFDGFPYFSRDGKELLFCSNRADAEGHHTHVFLADFEAYWEE